MDFFFSLEDENISDILVDYYDAKDRLDDAKKENDDATNKYLKAKEDLAK